MNVTTRQIKIPITSIRHLILLFYSLELLYDKFNNFNNGVLVYRLNDKSVCNDILCFLSIIASRGTVREMRIYNAKSIFLTIPPLSTTLRKFYMKESFVLLTPNGRLWLDELLTAIYVMPIF